MDFSLDGGIKTQSQRLHRFTEFEKYRKSLIQHCERSELRLRGQKFIKNAKNGQFWRVFQILKLAVKQCYQTGQF